MFKMKYIYFCVLFLCIVNLNCINNNKVDKLIKLNKSSDADTNWQIDYLLEKNYLKHVRFTHRDNKLLVFKYTFYFIYNKDFILTEIDITKNNLWSDTKQQSKIIVGKSNITNISDLYLYEEKDGALKLGEIKYDNNDTVIILNIKPQLIDTFENSMLPLKYNRTEKDLQLYYNNRVIYSGSVFSKIPTTANLILKWG